MQNLYKDLEKILLSNDTFKSEDGKVLKNKVTESAVANDKALIIQLLKSPQLKKHFFDEIEKGVVAFNREKFIRFINTKEFLPNSFTSFTNKIGLHNGSEYLNVSDKVSLVWAYKDCVLEGGQDKEDQKRSEIFYNETLAPDEIDRLFEKKVLTNFKKYTKDGVEVPKEITDSDNLVIRGNNLLALHSIKDRFQNKIKLIYIDPPFNTGSDSFGYNDKFNHSTWLTFMKNRLEVSKTMLREDGAIFVHIDDTESAYVKVLLDEIYGRENFLAQIAYQRSGAAGLGQGGKFVVNTAEFILVYAKNKTLFEPYNLQGGVPLEAKHMKRYNGVLVSEGSKKLIKTIKSKATGEDVKIYKHEKYKIETIPLANFEKRKSEILNVYLTNFEKIFRLNIPQKENSFQHSLISNMNDDLYSVEYVANRGKYKGEKITYHYFKKQLLAWLNSSAESNGKEIIKTNKLTDFWSHSDIPKADLANEGGVTLARGKKPEQLLRRIIDMSTQIGDFVLDFHTGSGTTAAVSHKMGRKYIGIEQLNYGDNDVVKRLNNVIKGDSTGISKSIEWKGGGSFTYVELKKWNQEYIDEIEDADTNKKILSVYEKMKKEAFFRYEIDLSKFDVKEFSKLEIADQKLVLLECLDKNHLYVNYTDINDATYKVSPEDKKLNKLFFGE